MNNELTNDELSSLLCGYNELYQKYLKSKRCRETNEMKESMISHWKKRCLDYQSVIKKIKPDSGIVFKELK